MKELLLVLLFLVVVIGGFALLFTSIYFIMTVPPSKLSTFWYFGFPSGIAIPIGALMIVTGISR